MSKKADIGGKRLISLAPEQWVKWVTQIPQIEVRDIISSEFQWISRESDVLMRVYTEEYGEFLVLNELQLRYNNLIPRRIRAYSALAEERYQQPIYPVLINILPTSPGISIPTSYKSKFKGLIARQDYHVINLWEVDVEIAFQQPLSALIPFVPILNGGGEEATVKRAVDILRNNQQLSELEPLLAFFATFVLEIPLIQEIMRWDMAILRESPWYQEILQQGMQQGIQQGMQQGIQQGLLSGIALGLELKFGVVSLQLMPEIRQIQNVEKLEAIQQGIKTANTWEELREIYR